MKAAIINNVKYLQDSVVRELLCIDCAYTNSAIETNQLESPNDYISVTNFHNINKLYEQGIIMKKSSRVILLSHSGILKVIEALETMQDILTNKQPKDRLDYQRIESKKRLPKIERLVFGIEPTKLESLPKDLQPKYGNIEIVNKKRYANGIFLRNVFTNHSLHKQLIDYVKQHMPKHCMLRSHNRFLYDADALLQMFIYYVDNCYTDEQCRLEELWNKLHYAALTYLHVDIPMPEKTMQQIKKQNNGGVIRTFRILKTAQANITVFDKYAFVYDNDIYVSLNYLSRNGIIKKNVRRFVSGLFNELYDCCYIVDDNGNLLTKFNKILYITKNGAAKLAEAVGTDTKAMEEYFSAFEKQL